MLSELPNLGPSSQAMLRRAGITTEAQLRKLGAVRAYCRVLASGAKPSLNLLWALEGALTGRRWQDVARGDRLGLLLQLESECPPPDAKSRERSEGAKPARGRPASGRRSAPR